MRCHVNLAALLLSAALLLPSAASAAGDPTIVLRWLPAAPTGEEQAALPQAPEAPAAPVPPAKGAKPELWDAHRKAQAAYREARAEWKAAKVARAKVARAIKAAKRTRLAADASVKKALVALRAQAVRTWPFAVARQMAAIGGCDGQAACLLAAGTASGAGTAFLLALSRSPGAGEARLQLVDLVAGQIAGEASLPFGKKGRVDGKILAKETRRLLGDARKVELARTRAAAAPLFAARNWAKAHGLIARALKLAPKAGDVRLWAGSEAFDAGDLKAARAHLSRAARQEAQAAQASELLGHIALRQNKDAEAARAFARAIEGGRDSFVARLTVARVKMKKDPAAASAHLTKALAERPDDGEANLMQGRLLLAKGEREAAGPFLGKALAAGLAPAQMHLELGLLALEKKDPEAALAHLAAAHAAGRATAASLFAHGKMLARKDPARAAELLARARRKGERDPGLDLILGRAALEAGQQRLAEQALLRASKQTTTQGEAHLLLARLYAGRSDSVAAARHFDAAAAGGHDSVEGRRLLGLAAMARGDLAGARTHYEAAVEQAGTGEGAAELHFALGEVLLRLGEGKAALPHLEKAAEAGIRPATTEVYLGKASREAGDAKAALSHFEKAYAAGTQDPDALRAAARAKPGASAVPVWRRLLEALPGDGDASFALGQDAFTKGKKKVATKLLTRAATFEAHRGEAELMLGTLARKRGDLKAARAHFQKAAGAGTESLELHEALGLAALAEAGHEGAWKADRRDEAIAHLARVAEARPKDAKLALVVGELLAGAGRHVEARPLLLTALGLDAQRGRANLLLGRGFAASGETEKAATHFKAAEASGVASKASQMGIAAAARKAGRSAEAREALLQAVRLGPKDAAARLDLGLLLLDAREFEGAAEHLQIAAKLGADPTRSQMGLGRAREGLGQSDAALAAYHAVLKARPGQPEALVRAGLILADKGQAKAARPLLEKAFTERPDDATVALALGRVRLALGDAKGARPLLSQALGGKAGKEDTEVFLSVARAAAREGRPAESNRFLAPVLAANPKQVDALRLKGQNHLELGEGLGAVKAFEAALAAGAGKAGPGLRYDLGRALEAQGLREEAAKAFGESFAAGGPIEAGLAHARWLQETRGVDAALAEAKAAVEKKPTPEGLRLLAALRHASGDRAGAAAAWSRLIALGHDDGEAHLYLAREAVAAGQRKLARQHLALARNNHPDPGAVCALAGQLSFEDRQWSTARSELGCALERRPNDLRLAVMLAEAEVASKAFTEAESHLRGILRRVPDHRRAHYLLARTQDALGHPRRALEHYRAYVRLSATDDEAKSDLARIGAPLYRPLWPELQTAIDPDDATGPTRTAAFLRMGQVYARSGRYAEAARAFELAVKASPGGFEGNFALGLARLEQRFSAAALEPLRDAVLADPAHLGAREALAAALILQNQVPSAERMLDAVEKKVTNKRSLPAKQNRALILAMDGEFPAARKALAAPALRERGASSLSTALNLALIDLFSGQVKAAGARAEKILLERPTDPVANFVVARAKAAAGDHEGARASLRRAVAAEPDFALARYELGLSYMEAGKLEPARSALLRVTYLDPSFADAHARLGVVYGKLGHAAKELAAYDKAAALMAEEASARKRAGKLPTVAIAAFRALQEKSAWAWLSEGIPEALTTDLLQLGVVDIIERSRMDEIMKEVALGQMGVVDEETAPKLGKLLGARYILTGSFRVVAGKLVLDGRMLDTEEGSAKATARVSGKPAEIITLERRLGLALVSQITTVRAAQRKAFLAQDEGSVGALKNAALSRKMLFAGRPEEARAYLRKAMAEDPRYAAAAKSVKAAWGEVSQAIAILPLKNISGAVAHDWLSAGISESLTTDLRQVAGIFLVERMQIERAMNEMALGQFFDVEKAPEVGRQIGAGLLLIGSYQVVGDQLQIDSRLLDVTSGQVLLAAKVKGAQNDLFDLEQQLAEKIVDTLQVDLSDEERTRLAEGKPSVDDFKRLLQSQQTLAVASKPKPVRRVLVADFQGLRDTKPAPGLAGRCRDFFHAALVSNGLPAVVSEKERAAAAEQAKQQIAAMKAKAAAAAEAMARGEKPGSKDQDSLSLRERAGVRVPSPEVEAGKIALADAVLVGRCRIREGRLKLEVRAIMVETGEVRVAVGSDALLRDQADLKRGVFEELLRGMGLLRKLSDADILALAGEESSGTSIAMGGMLAARSGWRRRARWSVYGSGAAAVVAGALMLGASHYYSTAEEAAALRNASLSPAAFDHYAGQASSLQSRGDGLLVGGLGLAATAVGLAGYAAWNLMQDGPEPGSGLDTAPAVTFGVLPKKGGAEAAMSLRFW